LLAERLRLERKVFVTREPSDGPAGLQIRMVLAHRIKMDPAALAALFAADRIDHLYHTDGDRGIAVHLRAGTDVITDRYYVSSFAYQGMNLDWEWLWHMHAPCIRPDVTFFLDVPVDVCLQRIATGRGDHFELFENQKALTGVRRSYLAAIERLRHSGDIIEIVDGDAPPEGVHHAIWGIMQPLLTPVP
jgi:dTMP kinase